MSRRDGTSGGSVSRWWVLVFLAVALAALVGTVAVLGGL
jgi:hypothetical protein